MLDKTSNEPALRPGRRAGPTARQPRPARPALPEVQFADDGEVRTLHLGTEWVQGSMLIDAPFEIELEYVRRMMAWLLFVPPAGITKRHAIQLGLGAGTLTKFCYKKLRMRTTAIELNPQVIAACRGWFKLPPDDARLQVRLADAALAVLDATLHGTVDALQVDLYDHEAASPVLDSAEFYADCRRLLTDDGTMTVNLFGRSSSYAQSLAKISAAFGERAVWSFRPTREGNTVVLAQRNPTRPARAELQAAAEDVQARWGLQAAKWLRVLQPVTA